MSAGSTAREENEAGYEREEGIALPAEDLTQSATEGLIEEAVAVAEDSVESASGKGDRYQRMARALYRQFGHVLVTGLKGTGKTASVRELARRAASGEIPFLSEIRFVWFDCRDVPPEDSRSCLEGLFTSAGAHGDLVLCIDGLGTLLRAPHGENNNQSLRSALNRSGVRMIGILSDWEYNDLVGGDAEMLELFTRVELEEPSEETATEILRRATVRFREEFGVAIEETVIRKTVLLASNYLLNESFPAKALKLLRRACEDAQFERTQLGESRDEIQIGDILRVVSEKTGIPEETLAGEGNGGDYDVALSAAVMGQEAAVSAVAQELRLIKAGLVEPGKPASVLLFAGMTGVGKTELAKRLAELFSATKRLNVYTMGNFTEPHSVSGIIGVPPGYVGHDHGGRLINELNSDPYSVFLLDEAEKAHPNVWKPFLNLFDEGWIVDQRGVKAHADRAIFILTTNAGGDAISQMTKSGKPFEEILDRVKTTLSRVRLERSSQPVFTPQFLARIKRTIVFNALDETAMVGICRKMVSQIQSLWSRKREKTIEVSPELIECIGRRAHELNESSGGKEGGRIVRKLLTDFVESSIQNEADRCPDDYKSCRSIRLEFAGETSDGEDKPMTAANVRVSFE